MQDVKTKEIIYISPAFTKIHEILIEDVIKNHKAWQDKVHPEDIERVTNSFTMKNALEVINREGVFKESYRIKSNDGSYKWIMSKYIPIKNDEGEIIRLLGIDQDITKIKDIEEKLNLNYSPTKN